MMKASNLKKLIWMKILKRNKKLKIKMSLNFYNKTQKILFNKSMKHIDRILSAQIIVKVKKNFKLILSITNQTMIF